MGEKTWVRRAGYGAFTSFALFVSFYLTFPADAVGKRIAREVSAGTGGRVSVSFDDIGLHWLTGIAADDVMVRIEGEDKPTRMALDTVTVRLPILSLLTFSPVVDANVRLGEGTVSATVGQGKPGETSADVAIDSLQFSEAKALGQALGLPLDATLTGTADVDWNEDARKSTGVVSVTLDQLQVGPGEVKGFTLPKVGLGKLDLTLDMQAGRLKLAEFKQLGGDIALELQGSSTLKAKLSSSSLDLCIKAKPNEEFLNKHAKLKTAVELAQVQFRKDTNGYLNIVLAGSMTRPTQRRGLCRKPRK